MGYLDKIDDFCRQRRMSYSRLSVESGLDRSTILKWKGGEKRPRMDSLQKVANYMQMSLNDFLSEDLADLYPHDALYDTPDIVRDAALRYIPVYRILDTDSPDPEEILTHIAVLPDNISSADECFGYAISDSAMAPDILAGDIVIARIDDSPESGDIVLVCIPGEQTICRRLIRGKGTIVLQPFNPHFAPSIFREEELDQLQVSFRGKVVATVRTVNSSAYSVPEI